MKVDMGKEGRRQSPTWALCLNGISDGCRQPQGTDSYPLILFAREVFRYEHMEEQGSCFSHLETKSFPLDTERGRQLDPGETRPADISSPHRFERGLRAFKQIHLSY